MKFIFRQAAFLLILTAAATFGAFAQDKTDKQETFGKIAKFSQSKKPEDVKKGYDLAKIYLAQYGKDNDENAQKLKKFVDGYRKSQFDKALDDKRMSDAVAFGKEMLADNPNDVYVKMNLAYGGYEALTKKQDKTFAADSIDYAKQTLAAFNAGTVPATFAPFKSKDDAAAYMHYAIGVLTDDLNSKDAAGEFYQVTKLDSQLKENPYPYYAIAAYYESVYQKMANDYQTKFGAKTTDDAEVKAAQDSLAKILDRMLDAYARAIKVAETDSTNQSKAGWITRFNEIYKARFQKTDGADEYTKKILASTLPDPNTL